MGRWEAKAVARRVPRQDLRQPVARCLGPDRHDLAPQGEHLVRGGLPESTARGFASRPTVRPGGSERRRLEREQHLGANARARERVVGESSAALRRRRAGLPGARRGPAAARSGSARRLRSGRRSRARFPTARPSSPRCAAPRSRRAAAALRPSAAKRIISTRRARSSARRRRAGSSPERARPRCECESAPVVPITHGTRRRARRGSWATTAPGAVSRSRLRLVQDLDEGVTLRRERPARARADLPPRRVEDDVHAAVGRERRVHAVDRGPRSAPRRARCPRRTAARARAARTPARRARPAPPRRSRRRSVDGQQLGVSDQRLPCRLIRIDVDSFDRTIRPLRFSFARSSSRGRRLPAALSAILVRRDVEALDEVLLARCRRRSPPGPCRCTASRSCRRRTPSRASRGSLEQARRRRAAVDRVEQRRGEAAPSRSARCRGRRCRRGTARCPCAGSEGPGGGAANERAANVHAFAGASSRRCALSISFTNSLCSRFPAAERTMLPPTYIERWVRGERATG